jgi:hypothetical protein
VFKGVSQPRPGRRDQESRHIKRAAKTLGAKCFEHEICKRTEFHFRAKKPEKMRRFGTETCAQAGPGRGILGRQRANGGQGFAHIG